MADNDRLAQNARMMRALADEIANRVSIRDISRDKELLNVLLEPVIRSMIDGRVNEIVGAWAEKHNRNLEQVFEKVGAMIKEWVEGRLEQKIQSIKHVPVPQDIELWAEHIELRKRVVELEALLTPGRPAHPNGNGLSP